jgi:lipocalin
VGIAAAVLLGVSIFLANRDPEVLIASSNQPVYQDEAPLVNYPGTWSEVFRTPEPNRLGLENEFETELAALNSLREDLVFELDFSN